MNEGGALVRFEDEPVAVIEDEARRTVRGSETTSLLLLLPMFRAVGAGVLVLDVGVAVGE